jgi:hypothetical protein
MGETRANRKSTKVSLDSRFMKTLLILLTGFLVFIGPTYVPYAAISVLKMSFTSAMLGGIVLFFVGLFLLWFLIRKKIIS